MDQPKEVVTDLEIAHDIAEVAARLGSHTISRSNYLQHGRFSHYYLYEGGRTWESLCKLAHVTCEKKEPVPDDLYYERLAKAIDHLGRLPKASERKRYGLNFSKSRFPTLSAFIQSARLLQKIDGSLLPGVLSPDEAPPPAQQMIPQVPHVRSTEVATGRPVPPIPQQTRRLKWERTNVDGFPYAPQDELGVVALFAILCSIRKLQWEILELRGGKGIDATCYDHTTSKEIRVELKYHLSRASWNHKLDEIDYVVCWENRWHEFPKPVIVLSQVLM